MSKVSIKTYYQTALDLHKSGKLSEARKLYDEILGLNPKFLEAYYMKGQTFYQEKKFREAVKNFDQGLALQANHPDLLLQKGRALLKVGDLDAAKQSFDYLVEYHNDNPKVLFHAARNLKELGAFNEAVMMYKKVIELMPTHKEALNNLGNLYQQLYQYESALDCYDKLIKLDPKFDMAYCNKAGLLQRLNKLDESRELYKKTLQLNSGSSLAIYNLGVIESIEHNFEEALNLQRSAIELAPDNPKYISTYASNLYQNGDREKALNILRSLIDQGIMNEDPYLKLGKIWMNEFDFDKFLNLVIPYIEKNKYAWESIFLTGAALDINNRLEEAENYLNRVADHPEFRLRANMTLQLLYSKLGRVDKYQEMLAKVTSLLSAYVEHENHDEDIPVYNLSYYPYPLDLAARVTRKFTKSLQKKMENLKGKLDFTYKEKGKRLKIGYLSPNFRLHPDAMLAKDLFEHHDREEFEVFAYSLRRSDDELGQLIKERADHFVDLSELKVNEAATRINDDGINILISLSGYNLGMRMEIPALRPAPVQANYMGYNETLQADFFDYAFGDKIVFTEENRKYFSESIAFLPTSYFLNSAMIPSDKAVTRQMYSLPEDKIVFGCLNHPRKLSHWVVDAWFEVLKNVPDSVLWLYDGNQPKVQTNLRDRAAMAGIDRNRLVFCGREYYKDHYSRLKLIDLFLDTPIYNGHTTCLEALWMKVPVLTIQGESVSSRLCSSFMHAVGMPDLVAKSIDEYTQKAISIGNDPNKLDSYKQRMIEARENSELFDVPRLVSRLEKSYKEMWNLHENGVDFRDIYVDQ